ncbi:MAG: hypothetical protein ABL904_17110 [Hyphomicrobiaceae bacterium]
MFSLILGAKSSQRKGDVVDFRTGELWDDGTEAAEVGEVGSVPDWYGERVGMSDGDSETVDNAYAGYVAWCSSNAVAPVDAATFRSAMADLGIMRQRIAGYDRFIGIVVG